MATRRYIDNHAIEQIDICINERINIRVNVTPAAENAVEEKKNGQEFYHGFALAVGHLAKAGYGDLCEYIMDQFDITLEDLEKAGCDENDLTWIREMEGQGSDED